MRSGKSSFFRRADSLTLESLEARQLLAADGASLIADAYTVQQNSRGHELDVLANDLFDADYAGAKQITDVSLGSLGGRISIAADGKSLLYDAPADGSGEETFTYYVDDEHSATVEVQVEAPLRDDLYEFVPDRLTWNLEVLENDSFWEDYQGERKITLVSASSRGATVEIAEDGKSLTYTRLDHEYRADTLIYIVDDKYPAAVVVDIAPPVESDRFQFVQFSNSRTVRPLDNDPLWEDYPGDRLITHLLDVPEEVDIAVAEDGRSVVFDASETPAGNYGVRYVIDSQFEGYMTFQVENPVRSDYEQVDTNSQQFPVPVMANDFYYQLGNFRQKIYATEEITSVSETEQGGVVTIADGGRELLYTPPAGFVGNDSFTYTSDGKHAANVTISVRDPLSTERNRDDYYTLYQGTEDNRLNVLSNDFDGNGYTGERKITSVDSVEGADVTIAGAGRALLFTQTDPEKNYFEFQYEVDNTLSATVRVSTRSIARSHYINIDSPSTYSIDVISRSDIPANYVGERQVTSVTQPENGGTATINSNGRSINVEPGEGTTSFQYTIDGQHTATVSLNYNQRLQSDHFVLHMNDGQTEFDVLANDFNDYSETRWGSYRGPRVITGVDSASENGTISIAADGKSVLYTPVEDYVGSDSFTYTIDGYLQVTSRVDVARLLRHDIVHVEPGATETLNVLANDLVGGEYKGALDITGVTAGVDGATVAIAEDGKSLVYSAADGFIGTDTLEYAVDGKLKATVTVEVNTPEGLYPTVDSLDAFRQLVLDATESSQDFFFNPINEDVAFDSDSGGVPSGREHSETNVQVEGVDEADLIETDSDYLYTLTHGQLVITKAWPADSLEVLSRTDIKGSVIGQYLHGDRVTVISQEYGWFGFFDDVAIDLAGDSIWPYPESKPVTYVTVLDVTDRAAPKLVQRTELEGSHVQTRRIDENVYVVVRDPESLVPQREQICEEIDGSEVCRHETNEERKSRIETDFASVVEDLLPNYESYGPDGKLVRAGLLIQPEDIFEPITEGANSLVTVASINISNSEPGIAAASGVLTTGASQLYVTADNLYVFENHYSWRDEKLEDSTTTKILKFTLDRATGGVDFAATGQVPGQFLNQFSADEYDGHLRVATQVSNNGAGNYSGGNENALFVLQDDGGILEPVGTLQNLALNESIQSVRFFGERALVTTFQNIDPLFSLDLSDHTSPQVEGYLTLPGFSSYMQFVDEDHVLTIGRSTGGTGAGVVMVSLFDVSDMLQPVLVDQFNWSSFSHSPAESDHHAFGWFSSHDTLAIPSQQNYRTRSDEDGDGYAETINNVTEYRLNAFGIDTTQATRSDDGITLNGFVDMDSPLLRSAFIGDKLYAIAMDSIVSTEISEPGEAIAKVDISRPDDEEPVEEFDERLSVIAGLNAAARQDLVMAHGFRDAEIMTVATESDDEQTRMLLRVADEQYVYHALGDQLQQSDVQPVTETRIFDWHNEASPLDTNGDGFVTARDALAIINMINADDGGMLPTGNVVNQLSSLDDSAQVDINNDGQVTARDVLAIVNYLNSPQSQAASVDAIFAAAMDDDDE